MSAVCSTLEVARSNIAEQVAGRPAKRRGRPPRPDEDLVEAIKAIIGSLPTYGYRRVHALLVHQARERGQVDLLRLSGERFGSYSASLSN